MSRTARKPPGCCELARDAERILLADSAYRDELARWAGGARDRDGIPDEVMAPRDPGGNAPVRDFTPDPARCGRLRLV